MKVAVVGAGVVGVLTAHYLRQCGHEVSVFDGEPGPAKKTSHANGAQLSYSFTDAMASPSLLTKMPEILLGMDPAFKISLSFNPDFISWGVRFLRNCTAKRAEKNTLILQRLALESAELMKEFFPSYSELSSYKKSGKLVLLPSEPDNLSRMLLDKKRALGCDVNLISNEEIYEVEPSLKQWNLKVNSAIYSPEDAAADPYLFSQLLCKKLEEKGVRFLWNTVISKVQTKSNKVVGLACGKETYDCDAVVLCTATDQASLSRQLGIYLPILPIAGYSVTLPIKSSFPESSITALGAKTVFCRLGDQLRIAGFADINGSSSNKAERVKKLISGAQKIAPDIADYDVEDTKSWIGYRPATPNSLPICSGSKIDGLFFNLGHGQLGWTLAAVTAKNIAQLV